MKDQIQYLKTVIDPELWRSARASAIRAGQTMRAWMTDAIKSKLGRENGTGQGKSDG